MTDTSSTQFGDLPNDLANAMAPAAVGGDASKAAAPPLEAAAQETRSRQIKARVLVDCDHGPVNAVVLLPSAEAKAGVRDGLLDTDRDAVSYAESLKD